jgi:hypothetical protein
MPHPGYMDNIRAHTIRDDFWNFEDDAKYKREERARKNGLEPCTNCGRGVKPGNGWVVEIINGGGQAAHRDDTANPNDDGYMGCWVVGPECGRKIPMEYRTKWNGWDE